MPKPKPALQPASATVAPASTLSAWMFIAIAGLFGILGVINLYAQLVYEFKGSHASGEVLEFHAASGHSRTVYATVLASPAGVAPFRWDVEDTFGVHDWAVGGTVPLLCAHMHADHVSCVIDSYPQRYLWQIMLTFFGCGIAGWCVTRLLRPKEPLAAAAP
jgi:hypothetical protein